MSAPARACDSASRRSSSRVASLSTSPSLIAPQWPWSVYSHMQTSVITASAGTCSLISPIARCTEPESLQASLPIASLCSGRPNRMTAGTPAAAISRASRVAMSGDSCATPGIDLIGLLTPRPGHTNRGWIRLSGLSRVSRTIRRSTSVRRNLRGRFNGKAIVGLHRHAIVIYNTTAPQRARKGRHWMAADEKFTALNRNLHKYLLDHGHNGDPLLAELAAETAKLGADRRDADRRRAGHPDGQSWSRSAAPATRSKSAPSPVIAPSASRGRCPRKAICCAAT